MGKLFRIPNIYIILLISHIIMGYINAPVSILRIVFIPRYALEIWFIYNCFKYLSSSPYMKMLTLLVVVFLLYGCFLLLIGVDSSWRIAGDWGRQYITDYVGSLIPIFIFYYLGVTGQINEKWFFGVAILFLICASVEYYYASKNILLNNISESTEGYVNNMGYLILSVFPAIMFIGKKPVLQYVALGIVFVLVIMSYKKGAILSCIAALLYFILSNLSAKGNSKKRMFIICLSFVAILLGVEYFKNTLANDFVLQTRFENAANGQFGAREDIYSRAIHFIFNENNPFTLLFGNGAYSTCKYFGTMAHNDWLEITMDLGLVGLFLYIRYWITLYKTMKRSKTIVSKEIFDAMALFCIIYFIPTFFSMSISAITIYSGSVIGFCAGALARIETSDNLLINQENGNF